LKKSPTLSADVKDGWRSPDCHLPARAEGFAHGRYHLSLLERRITTTTVLIDGGPGRDRLAGELGVDRSLGRLQPEQSPGAHPRSAAGARGLSSEGPAPPARASGEAPRSWWPDYVAVVQRSIRLGERPSSSRNRRIRLQTPVRVTEPPFRAPMEEVKHPPPTPPPADFAPPTRAPAHAFTAPSSRRQVPRRRRDAAVGTRRDLRNVRAVSRRPPLLHP
jgi:hypothetical protein